MVARAPFEREVDVVAYGLLCYCFADSSIGREFLLSDVTLASAPAPVLSIPHCIPLCGGGAVMIKEVARCRGGAGRRLSYSLQLSAW